MLRLLAKLLLASAAIAAVWTWAPVRGRTLADRWRAAPTAAAFFERGWSELRGVVAGPPHGRASIRSQARGPQGSASRERPIERHTDADRRAVDRIVSDGLERAH
jgi:hypothetical protein